MDIEDDLREITEKDLEKTAKETKYKKIIIVAISIFLVLLVMPYFILGNNIFYIIEGKLVSEKIKSDFEYICDCGEIRVSKFGLNSNIGLIHYLLLKPEKFRELVHESLKRKNGLVAKL